MLKFILHDELIVYKKQFELRQLFLLAAATSVAVLCIAFFMGWLGLHYCDLDASLFFS
jgi:hypothetical protein